ncbi:MAG: coenzyme F420-0:L-glutamate ligase [Sphingomonadales bacterium]|nr:coenzyme F420-0:L-glutamate ligase [Sphingomonadales bacterium]MDE2569459.1 coenzyme F420-0:L-glutamate ligase [Sphingomonadales bacterium]
MYSVMPIDDLPEFAGGEDLPGLLAERLRRDAPGLMSGDVLVVTQKIVSKAESRFVDLAEVIPSAEAAALAAEVDKTPALVELVLRESSEVVRKARNVLITRHRLGCVMANAGIDASNVGPGRSGQVLLLPQDPDLSAARIADACERAAGVRPGVIISDSFGRPWRIGTVNVAIGVAAMPAVVDQRGGPDRDGRVMQVTQIGLADAVAAAAGLVMGEGAEGLPAAIVRGLGFSGPAQDSRAIVRPTAEDLFR